MKPRLFVEGSALPAGERSSPGGFTPLGFGADFVVSRHHGEAETGSRREAVRVEEEDLGLPGLADFFGVFLFFFGKAHLA